MAEGVDPSTQRQIEEFHRRVQQAERFWQGAVTRLAVERIRQDMVALSEPPARWRRLGRAGVWLERKFAALARKERRDVEGEPDITVIDSVCRDVSSIPSEAYYRHLKDKVK